MLRRYEVDAFALWGVWLGFALPLRGTIAITTQNVASLRVGTLLTLGLFDWDLLYRFAERLSLRRKMLRRYKSGNRGLFW